MREIGEAAYQRMSEQESAKTERRIQKNAGPLTKRRALIPSEHQEQVALFGLIDRDHEFQPRCAAIPNGTYDGATYEVGEGAAQKRASKASRDARKEGRRAGYPDCTLDWARGPFFGCRWEMKRINAVPSELRPEQRKRGHQLNLDGYLCFVAHGCDDAWRQLNSYRELGPFDPGMQVDLSQWRVISPAAYPV